ncbi:MAG TPA: hypothetical protein VG963_18400, partial [Polyangiaceae bacterium]|nr:hypothetical protein [Polyangiaceae bacterium]
EPFLEALAARFRALTREEVNAAIRRHVAPGRLQIAIVAPGAHDLAEALVRGDASPIRYETEKPPALLAEDAIIAKHPLGLAHEQVNILPLASIFR